MFIAFLINGCLCLFIIGHWLPVKKTKRNQQLITFLLNNKQK